MENKTTEIEEAFDQIFSEKAKQSPFQQTIHLLDFLFKAETKAGGETIELRDSFTINGMEVKIAIVLVNKKTANPGAYYYISYLWRKGTDLLVLKAKGEENISEAKNISKRMERLKRFTKIAEYPQYNPSREKIYLMKRNSH